MRSGNESEQSEVNQLVISIIGGAGVRTPLLVRGLAQSGLPIGEIRVFDIDRDRLALMAPLIDRVAGVGVVVSPTVAACVGGAHFVVASIRPGGIAARARYELLPRRFGRGVCRLPVSQRVVPVAGLTGKGVAMGGRSSD